MSATDFDPFVRPRVGHLQEDLKAAGSDRYATGAGAEGEGFSFDDALDILNPLHHLPVVGSLYRELTGDRIGGTARIIGGGLFGGVFGLVGAAFNQVFEDATGRDMAETALAAMSGEELADPGASAQVAADDADTGGADTGGAANEQEAAAATTQLANGEVIAWNAPAPAAAADPPVASAARAAPADTPPQAHMAAASGDPAAAGEALTGAAALAAFAADVRRGAATGPAAPKPGAASEAPAPTPAPAPAPAPAQGAQTAALGNLPAASAGRPGDFMPVSPRDFAGPRPQTAPNRPLAVESPLPPQPNRPVPPRTATQAQPAPAPESVSPLAATTGASPAAAVSGLPAAGFAAPPVSDADFAARMMQALQKYEAMSQAGS